MRLTKKQREEVVERLRCAADAFRMGVARPWADWFYDLGVTNAVHLLACRAWEEAYSAWDEACDGNPQLITGDWWSTIALEAALLVEEGVLP